MLPGFKHSINGGVWATIPHDFADKTQLEKAVRARADVPNGSALFYCVGTDNFPWDIVTSLAEGEQRVLVQAPTGNKLCSGVAPKLFFFFLRSPWQLLKVFLRRCTPGTLSTVPKFLSHGLTGSHKYLIKVHLAIAPICITETWLVYDCLV